MGILKTIGKVAGAIAGTVVPTLGKEKKKIESVDTLLTNRGKSSKVEGIIALGYKYIRLGFIIGLTIAILSGRVTVGEVIKVITTVTAIG